jgi:hypothetical protein
MDTAAKPRRATRTLTVDGRDDAPSLRLMADRKAVVDGGLAFLQAVGFQLTPQATGNGGDCLMRHAP